MTSASGSSSSLTMTGPWQASVGYSERQGYGLLSGAALFTNQYATPLSFPNIPSVCGDGVRTGAEACDGLDLDDKTCAGQAGYSDGALSCLDTCALDLSQCAATLAVCGDDILSVGEECEPPNFDSSASCNGLGYLSANTDPLSCDNTCQIDASSCRFPPLQGLAAGTSHACALYNPNAGGSLLPICWGDNSQGQAAAPQNFFSTLAVGDGFSCGIVFNGTLQCWGASLQDALGNNPATDTRINATHIAAAGGHMCAVDANTSTVQCFADNGPPLSTTAAFAPIGLAMSAAWLCVLNEESPGITSTYCVPTDSANQSSLSLFPIEPSTQIAVSNDMLCALNALQQIECAGAAIQPGAPPLTGLNTTASYVALRGGNAGMCALADLGAGQRRLDCWTLDSSDPARVSPFRADAYPLWLSGFNFADDFTVSDSAICVSDRGNGNTYCFDFQDTPFPHQGQHIAPGIRALSVGLSPAANDSTGCIVKQVSGSVGGYLSCWGDWSDLAQAITYDNLTQVSVGAGALCALDIDGKAYCVPRDGVSIWPPISELPLSTLHVDNKIACGVEHDSAALTCWGDTDTLANMDLLPTGAFSDVRVMDDRGVCALTTAGELLCTLSALQLPPELAAKRWVSFDAISTREGTTSFNHACAIDTAGELTCWGDSLLDQPTAPDGQHFSRVSVAAGRACVLIDDGKIRCWGTALRGSASSFDHLAPDLRSLDVGGAQTCGLRRNGDVVCVGDRELGYR